MQTLNISTNEQQKNIFEKFLETSKRLNIRDTKIDSQIHAVFINDLKNVNLYFADTEYAKIPGFLDYINNFDEYVKVAGMARNNGIFFNNILLERKFFINMAIGRIYRLKELGEQNPEAAALAKSSLKILTKFKSELKNLIGLTDTQVINQFTSLHDDLKPLLVELEEKEKSFINTFYLIYITIREKSGLDWENLSLQNLNKLFGELGNSIKTKGINGLQKSINFLNSNRILGNDVWGSIRETFEPHSNSFTNLFNPIDWDAINKLISIYQYAKLTIDSFLNATGGLEPILKHQFIRLIELTNLWSSLIIDLFFNQYVTMFLNKSFIRGAFWWSAKFGFWAEKLKNKLTKIQNDQESNQEVIKYRWAKWVLYSGLKVGQGMTFLFGWAGTMKGFIGGLLTSLGLGVIAALSPLVVIYSITMIYGDPDLSKLIVGLPIINQLFSDTGMGFISYMGFGVANQITKLIIKSSVTLLRKFIVRDRGLTYINYVHKIISSTWKYGIVKSYDDKNKQLKLVEEYFKYFETNHKDYWFIQIRDMLIERYWTLPGPQIFINLVSDFFTLFNFVFRIHSSINIENQILMPIIEFNKSMWRSISEMAQPSLSSILNSVTPLTIQKLDTIFDINAYRNLIDQYTDNLMGVFKTDLLNTMKNLIYETSPPLPNLEGYKMTESSMIVVDRILSYYDTLPLDRQQHALIQLISKLDPRSVNSNTLRELTQSLLGTTPEDILALSGVRSAQQVLKVLTKEKIQSKAIIISKKKYNNNSLL